MTRKTTKNDGFLTVFWSFWVLGPILAHQTAKFKLSGQFCFSRHPWGHWGRLSSGVICISKIYHLFCDSGGALVDFFKLTKMLPNVSFISMVIKKMFLSVSIAAISNFLQKCTHCRHNYELSQPKIGQCVYVVYTNCFLFLFWHSEQFMYTTCSDLVVFMCWTGKLMNNILSHCGFVILD